MNIDNIKKIINGFDKTCDEMKGTIGNVFPEKAIKSSNIFIELLFKRLRNYTLDVICADESNKPGPDNDSIVDRVKKAAGK